MNIAELLNVKEQQISVGDTVFVANSGHIYTSFVGFAEGSGYPDAAVDDISASNPIGKKVYNDLYGNVLFIGKHKDFCINGHGGSDDMICVVETEEGFKFLISIRGLRKQYKLE